MQALAGQVEEGVALHKNWSAAWKRFGWLPEMFDLGMDNRHPTETGAAGAAGGCEAGAGRPSPTVPAFEDDGCSSLMPTSLKRRPLAFSIFVPTP